MYIHLNSPQVSQAERREEEAKCSRNKHQPEASERCCVFSVSVSKATSVGVVGVGVSVPLHLSFSFSMRKTPNQLSLSAVYVHHVEVYLYPAVLLGLFLGTCALSRVYRHLDVVP